jgi:hypothetical protein
MTRLPSIVVAGLLFLLGIASCSSSSVRPQYKTSDGSLAAVTGFASAPVMAGGSPSRPVTVRVTGMRASRLTLLVNRLPSVSQSQVSCHEPLGLMYRIVFGNGTLAKSRAVVAGYRCDAAVAVTVAGQISWWRRDAHCALLRAVRQVLPRRAKATQRPSIGCDSRPAAPAR